MTGPVYDEHVEMYLQFLERAMPTLFERMITVIGERLAGRLEGARVLDIACGEGYLSRYLGSRAPREVIGIDISSVLIDVARERSEASNLSFHVDDAQTLATIDDGSIDVAVSQMAVMDIVDHTAMFTAARRILKAGGAFVFSLLHPCFEGPFRPPDEHPLLDGADGEPVARVVWRYATEGHWRPESSGVRSHVGSYHRTLSTYLNDLVAAGFRFQAMDETVFEDRGLFSEVPRVMIVSALADEER